MPSTTLSFAFKDGLQRAMPAFDPATQHELYSASRLAAGGLAGVLALAVVYPLDLTTIRMAANVGAQRDQGAAARAAELRLLAGAGRWRGMWAGKGRTGVQERDCEASAPFAAWLEGVEPPRRAPVGASLTVRTAGACCPAAGMIETIQGSTRRAGLAGLYRGFTVSAVAIGGYKALYFG